MSVPVFFDYKAPDSVKEAVALLNETKDARPLAGGHELVTRLKLRRETSSLLVDLKNIPDLKKVDHDDNLFRIGAMVTLNDLVAHIPDTASLGVLVEAANSIGDAQVRNCTTVGGNIGGGNPAADLAAALLALDAKLTIVGHFGTREVSVDQFYVGPFDTVLEGDEIITLIEIPLNPGSGAYEKIANAASSYPICGAAVVVSLTDKKAVSDCRVGLTGATIHPVRLHEVEAALKGKKADAGKIAEASKLAGKGQTFVSDNAASEEYRAQLAKVAVERALTRAAAQASSS